jgi:hypothetical protein
MKQPVTSSARRRPVRGLAALGASAALLLAACGSDNKSATTTKPAPTA